MLKTLFKFIFGAGALIIGGIGFNGYNESVEQKDEFGKKLGVWMMIVAVAILVLILFI